MDILWLPPLLPGVCGFSFFFFFSTELQGKYISLYINISQMLMLSSRECPMFISSFMSDDCIFQQMDQVQPGTLTYPGNTVKL